MKNHEQKTSHSSYKQSPCFLSPEKNIYHILVVNIEKLSLQYKYKIHRCRIQLIYEQLEGIDPTENVREQNDNVPYGKR